MGKLSNNLGVIAAVTFTVLFVLVTDFQATEAVSVERDLNLTIAQKNTLDKFREKVNPILYRDFMKYDLYLIRWLRARDFDADAAETMLRTHLKWRKDNKMDTIFQEDWSDIRKDYPVTIDTFDKENRPIGTIDIWEWNIRLAAIQGKAPRVLKYLDYLLETLMQQVFDQQLRGRNVTQFLVIGNAEGFNIVQHACPLCIPYWIQFVQSLEANYVGWLDELIIIDAPVAINIVLEAVRPFLSKQTSDALKIFTPNRRKWLPYIDERVSKEQRRAAYGGTKKRD